MSARLVATGLLPLVAFGVVTLSRVDATELGARGVLETLPQIGVHRLFGFITALKGTSVTIRIRSGKLVQIDASAAIANNRVSEPLYLGKAVVVHGGFGLQGKFVASVLARAASDSMYWGRDY